MKAAWVITLLTWLSASACQSVDSAVPPLQDLPLLIATSPTHPPPQHLRIMRGVGDDTEFEQDALLLVRIEGDHLGFAAVNELGLTLLDWPASSPRYAPLAAAVARMIQIPSVALSDWRAALKNSHWSMVEDDAMTRVLLWHQDSGRTTSVLIVRPSVDGQRLDYCVDGFDANEVCAGERIRVLVSPLAFTPESRDEH